MNFQQRLGYIFNHIHVGDGATIENVQLIQHAAVDVCERQK